MDIFVILCLSVSIEFISLVSALIIIITASLKQELLNISYTSSDDTIMIQCSMDI